MDDSEKIKNFSSDYEQALHVIDDLSSRYGAIEQSHEYLLGKKILSSRWLRFIGAAYDLARSVKLGIPYKSHQSQNTSAFQNNMRYSDTSELYEYKIVIYTCIIGDYDRLWEPGIKPGNVDYILMTDGAFPLKSAWKSIDVRSIKGMPALDNVRLTRYVKLHPHLLLNDYDYSIYIDGNIQPLGDLRYLIHNLNESGFVSDLHYSRNCIYEELAACVRENKDDERIMRKQIEAYRNAGMPEHYGLIESNLLVRDHHNSVCIEMMERWWQEIVKYSRRDQLSLPFVLWEMGIPVAAIGQISNNVYKIPSIRLQPHAGCPDRKQSRRSSVFPNSTKSFQEK